MDGLKFYPCNQSSIGIYLESDDVQSAQICFDQCSSYASKRVKHPKMLSAMFRKILFQAIFYKFGRETSNQGYPKMEGKLPVSIEGRVAEACRESTRLY